MTSCCGLAATVRIGFVLIGSRNSIGIALRLKESVKAGDESVDTSMV